MDDTTYSVDEEDDIYGASPDPKRSSTKRSDSFIKSVTSASDQEDTKAFGRGNPSLVIDDPAMDPALEPSCPGITAHITLDPMQWYHRNFPDFANRHPDPDDVETIVAQNELVELRLERENARRVAVPANAAPSATTQDARKKQKYSDESDEMVLEAQLSKLKQNARKALRQQRLYAMGATRYKRKHETPEEEARRAAKERVRTPSPSPMPAQETNAPPANDNFGNALTKAMTESREVPKRIHNTSPVSSPPYSPRLASSPPYSPPLASSPPYSPPPALTPPRRAKNSEFEKALEQATRATQRVFKVPPPPPPPSPSPFQPDNYDYDKELAKAMAESEEEAKNRIPTLPPLPQFPRLEGSSLLVNPPEDYDYDEAIAKAVAESLQTGEKGGEGFDEGWWDLS